MPDAGSGARTTSDKVLAVFFPVSAFDDLASGRVTMTVTSISRIVVPSLALVAACGAALVFGITNLPREPPVEVPRRLILVV